MAVVNDHILKHVKKGSTIYTDDFLGYRKIGGIFNHQAVAHGAHEYVRGDVHSNNEFTYRFNRRVIGEIDAMIRDFSSVVPRSKSEIRRRLVEFVLGRKSAILNGVIDRVMFGECALGDVRFIIEKEL